MDNILTIYKPMNSPQETEIFRKMPPSDKLRLIEAIHMQAREWKRAAFKAQRPDWTPEQIVHIENIKSKD